MNYIDSNLLPGEEVLTRAHVDASGAFAPAGLWLAGWTIAGVFLMLGSPPLGVMVLVIGVVFAIPIAIGGYIRLTTCEYALTSRRVVAKEGVVRRRSFDVMLNKVEGVGVEQSILGRMLGYGSVVITGTGGSREPFKAIAAPFDFRSAVHAKLEELSDQN